MSNDSDSSPPADQNDYSDVVEAETVCQDLGRNSPQCILLQTEVLRDDKIGQWFYIAGDAWLAQPWLALLGWPLSLYSLLMSAAIYLYPEIKPTFADARSTADNSPK